MPHVLCGINAEYMGHGKRHLIQFDDKERSKLKSYFKSLDGDDSGSIGIDELEEPLISLGIAENRQDIKKIIALVDKDGSEQIEFNEFLDIIRAKNDRESAGSSLIIKFFKDMIDGRLSEGKISNNLSFKAIISTVRRQKLLAAIMEKDGSNAKKDGEKVLHAYGKMVALRKQRSQSIGSTSRQNSRQSSFSEKNKDQA
eukprot:TRINITY_DN10385_c0_g1_i4.p2 TRINITY_DN10385_c0_g1~~TRINITY_DN10385_c0_g1_i4.p2  ORF type:complete len:199 (-),score=45.60 TRINITY_DN10385_c0_g1_i4:353-949(-)